MLLNARPALFVASTLSLAWAVVLSEISGGEALPGGQPAAARATVGAYYFDGWAGQSQRWADDPAWTRLNPPTLRENRRCWLQAWLPWCRAWSPRHILALCPGVVRHW